MTGWPLWVLIVALGVVTYALRVAFILKPGRTHASAPEHHQTPPLTGFLRFVPAAALAALIVPALARGNTGSALPVAQWLAGLVGLVVAVWSAKHPAWRRYGVLLTLFSGLGTLWLLRLVGV